MTQPTQDDLAAGPDLDVLVAEKIMGWTQTKGMYGRMWWGNPSTGNRQLWIVENFCPSTDISAAFQIVEHMDSLGWKVQVRSDSQLEGYEVNEPWVCVFASRDGAPWAAAETAPLAICRAALRAVSG